jgi:lipoprotein-anchoring transpeptidase ErfK/SrfK
MTHWPRLTRRSLVGSSLALPLAAALPPAFAQDDGMDPASLKPGQFVWHPERSPSGAVVVLVSIPDQWVVVYRNGVRIGASTCSTGRPGHQTPAGVFVILQKDKNHHSSTYNNAPMPYMERLTWSGIALHAGNLPGYPASHGCVRLPLEFARLLYGVTTPSGRAGIRPRRGDGARCGESNRSQAAPSGDRDHGHA